MMKCALLFSAVLILFLPCHGHVRLTFPPARYPGYDFLDNVRTQGPCGVPKPDQGQLTTFLMGSTFRLSFHLAYPHRGGFSIRLINSTGDVLHYVMPSNATHLVYTDDGTLQHTDVTLPEDFVCDECILQLLRNAAEWGTSTGQPYLFWSCSDITIVNNSDALCGASACSGHGTCDGGVCKCDHLYSGEYCQFRDECVDNSDCSNSGTCVDTLSTNIPRKQCFCYPGYHGPRCEFESPLKGTSIDINEEDYTIARDLNSRLKMYARLVNENSEIEFAMVLNGTGWMAIGWKPSEDKLDGCRESAPGFLATGVPYEPVVSTETTSEGMPEEGTPEEGTPEEGTPEEGTPEEGTPEEGTPEEGTPEGSTEATPEGSTEAAPEGSTEAAPEGSTEAAPEGSTEAAPEGSTEAAPEGSTEAAPEGSTEAAPEGSTEAAPEGSTEAAPEGSTEAAPEGSTEAAPEGSTEAAPEGSTEAAPEGSTEAAPEGSTEATPEGSTEAAPEGSTEAAPEGSTEAAPEGTPEDTTTSNVLHPMDCTDIVIIGARGMTHRIRDYYTRDRASPQEDDFYGGEYSLTAALAIERDGVTKAIFRRRLATSDPGDHSIEDELLTVIWAMGQTPSEFTHSPSSSLEHEEASNADFYQEDEIKYHGSDTRGSTQINFFMEDAQPASPCSGSFLHPSCNEDSCPYMAEWSVSGEFVRFRVAAVVADDEWAAIGFSDDTAMPNSDVVVGASNGMQSFIQDRFAFGREEPRVDAIQSIVNASVTRQNSLTILDFLRPLSSDDTTDDIQLTSCRYFIYGFGGSVDDFAQPQIGYHSSETPFVSPQRICLETRPDLCPQEPYNFIVVPLDDNVPTTVTDGDNTLSTDNASGPGIGSLETANVAALKAAQDELFIMYVSVGVMVTVIIALLLAVIVLVACFCTNRSVVYSLETKENSYSPPPPSKAEKV